MVPVHPPELFHQQTENVFISAKGASTVLKMGVRAPKARVESRREGGGYQRTKFKLSSSISFEDEGVPK